MPTATITDGTWVTWIATGTASTNATVAIWGNWTCYTSGATWAANNVAPAVTQIAPSLEAGQKAETLLRDMLAPEQRYFLDKMSKFVVESELGNRYEIRRGRMQNVFQLGLDGKPTHKLCAHPADWLPDADTMLAQKLMLESDEQAFRQLANITRL